MRQNSRSLKVGFSFFQPVVACKIFDPANHLDCVDLPSQLTFHNGSDNRIRVERHHCKEPARVELSRQAEDQTRPEKEQTKRTIPQELELSSFWVCCEKGVRLCEKTDVESHHSPDCLRSELEWVWGGFGLCLG